MKKFFIISGSLLLTAMGASANSGSPIAKKMLKNFTPAKTALRVKTSHSPNMRAAEAGSWEAQNESMYLWDGEWIHAEDNVLTFNEAAKILTQLTTEFNYDEIMGYTRTLYTYDANNMVTKRLIEASLDSENFTPADLRVVAYDPIVTNLIISNEQTIWINNEEHTGNSYKFNITRNDDENITLAERAVLFNGEFDPTERFFVEYGSDGKAIATKQTMLNYNGFEYTWVDTEEFTNIEWEDTDGQIYDQSSMMSGNNKMKSADMYDVEDDLLAHINIAYSADGGYTMTMIPDDEPNYVAEMIYTPLPNGGYRSYVTEKYYGEVEFVIEEIIEYADNGLILREYYYEEEMGDEPYIEESKGVLIGGTEDQPEAYEYSFYDQEEDEWYPNMRIEFSNYIFIKNDPSIIESITDNDAPAEYFNLQGMRLQQPAKGTICIERRGNKTQKIFVK